MILLKGRNCRCKRKGRRRGLPHPGYAAQAAGHAPRPTMGGSDVETGEGDASPTADDQRLEEARARSLEETEADFSTRSKQKGLLARCMKWCAPCQLLLRCLV